MKVRPRLLITSILVVLTISSLLFLAKTEKSAPSENTGRVLLTLNCPDKSESCLTEQLLKIQDNYGSKEALKQIGVFVKDNPSLVGSCHSVVHSLGISAYAKLKNMQRVFNEGGNICSWAFMHGAIIAAYRDSPIEQMPKLTTGLCQPLKELDGSAEAECYHGVGHAVMLITNSFAQGMRSCEMITEDRALTSCVQGAIMEFSSTFPTDPVGAAEVASKTYRDCVALEREKTRKYCVYSVGESNLRADGRDGNALPAWERCKLVGLDLLHDCAQGLGKAAPDQVGWTAAKASLVCNKLPKEYQQDCNLVAATTLGTVLLNEKYVTEYCNLVATEFREGCLSTLPEIRRYISENNNSK